jgi:hypothetical protein
MVSMHDSRQKSCILVQKAKAQNMVSKKKGRAIADPAFKNNSPTGVGKPVSPAHMMANTSYTGKYYSV